MEIRFELPGITGNPFDFNENDVVAEITKPGGGVLLLPAFFDGGDTWRVRHSPDEAGRHFVREITRNGKPVKPVRLEPTEFVSSGPTGDGFVRRDPSDATRFRFDSGKGYYPIGHNVAWGNGRSGDISGMFAKMGEVGENWSRVWMNHWDGKNLDWVMGRAIPLGELDLEVARRWDEVVEAAEREGIRFQMTLQHHGQYSSRVNPNWGENPWNRANGGFLETPEEFFTHPRAISLTKAKYRYILARWGYSTSVMAWELFNEVEWTDAISKQKPETVAAWHADLAAFLRRHDPYRHLVTTSSDRKIPNLYDAMDYIQPHAYPQDALPAVTSISSRMTGKPIFFGEIGPGGNLNADDGRFLRRALWGGMMSEASGAAQYWTWDHIDRRDFYDLFRPAAGFSRRAMLADRGRLQSVPLVIQTDERAPLSFSPGLGWDASKRSGIVVHRTGIVEGASEMPSYLQGRAHADLFTRAKIHVDYPVSGTFAVNIGQVARAGAHVVLSIDGSMTREKEFPASNRDTFVNETLSIDVPSGKKEITLENRGADWVVIRRIELDPYAPGLGAESKGDSNTLVAWIYRRSPETGKTVKGTVELPRLDEGRYRAVWWDTLEGKPLSETEIRVDRSALARLETPPVTSDVALIVESVPIGRAVPVR